MKKTKPVMISRRDFIKGTVGVAAGAALLGSTQENAFATIPSENPGLEPSGSEPSQSLFKDSIGRSVAVPAQIETVIPSGLYAQTVLCTLCPEKILSISQEIESSDKPQYEKADLEEIPELPKTGSMYSSGNRDIKTAKIDIMNADIIIDIGGQKNDLTLSLDYLQTNTETPTVFVDGSFGKLADAYRTLGQLLNCESRASQLADHVEEIQALIITKRSNVEKEYKILFAGNDLGLSNHENYSFQNEAISFLGGKPVEIPSGPIEGIIDKDELVKHEMDYIIFNDADCFNDILVAKGEAGAIWIGVDAIQNGHYALSPGLYHNWIGFPMFVQTIGLLWLGRQVWPSVYNYDLNTIAKRFL